MRSSADSSPVETLIAFDPYRVLGLERRATDAEIKRAYFQKVRAHPPEQAPEQFQEIRRAYDALRDPESKAKIDLFLLQPPPPLPNRRLAAYDLSVQYADLLILAQELATSPAQKAEGQ